MTLPSFASATAGQSAPSNAGISLPLPTGDPTGKLLVAVIAEYSVGNPTAPPGWTGPYGSNGLWVFTKIGELADSGGTVSFDPWTPEVTVQSSGIVLVYNNASGVDVASATAKASAASANAPQIRTKSDDTVVLGLFAVNPSAFDADYGVFSGTPSTHRADFTPDDDNKIWLLATDADKPSAGKTSRVAAATVYAGNWRALTIALHDWQAPNAPTLLAPEPYTTLDVDEDIELTWKYSNVDPANTQYSYDVQLTDLSIGGPPAPHDTAGVGSAGSFIIPAGTLIADHLYNWTVKNAGINGGGSGPFAPAQSFWVLAKPDVPTIVSPAADAIIDAPSQSAHFTGLVAGGFYQYRRVADLAGAPDQNTVYFDSGPLTTDTDEQTVALLFDTTGRDEHVQVRTCNFRIRSGVTIPALWSEWADVTVHVQFVPPPEPTASVGFNPSQGSITVGWDNPDATGDQPDAVTVDVYASTDLGLSRERKATGLPLNSQWVYWQPNSDQNYWFMVAAVAADGAVAFSDWVDLATIEPDNGAGIDTIIDGGGA